MEACDQWLLSVKNTGTPTEADRLNKRGRRSLPCQLSSITQIQKGQVTIDRV
jgi:hypothetical protein